MCLFFLIFMKLKLPVGTTFYVQFPSNCVGLTFSAPFFPLALASLPAGAAPPRPLAGPGVAEDLPGTWTGLPARPFGVIFCCPGR